MPADHVGATTTVMPPPSTTFVWKIQGVTPAFFTSAASGLDGTLTSPQFSAAGKEWKLMLYPNGHKPETAGKVAFLLFLCTPNVASFSPAVSFHFGGRDSKMQGCVLSTTTPKPAGSSQSLGCLLALHEVLLASPEISFPGGVLTFAVTICLQQFVVAEAGTAEALHRGPALPPLPPSCLASDFSSLLTSADGADVTLLCGAERIPAHATILCARSDTLRAQLRGPLSCPHDAVPVPDEIDVPTLKRTLHFIYTEECEPESAEEAQHLLNAADHYGLSRLRAICERTLIASLSVENVAFTLTLAEQHSAGVLRDAALRFVSKNAVVVMRTEGWAHLRASSPALMEAAMMTCVTGEPPQADDGGLGGEAADAAEGSGRRVRRRTQ